VEETFDGGALDLSTAGPAAVVVPPSGSGLMVLSPSLDSLMVRYDFTVFFVFDQEQVRCFTVLWVLRRIIRAWVNLVFDLATRHAQLGIPCEVTLNPQN
jgi:hypothetical protein